MSAPQKATPESERLRSIGIDCRRWDQRLWLSPVHTAAKRWIPA
jgi:hypothetical protein